MSDSEEVDARSPLEGQQRDLPSSPQYENHHHVQQLNGKDQQEDRQRPHDNGDQHTYQNHDDGDVEQLSPHTFETHQEADVGEQPVEANGIPTQKPVRATKKQEFGVQVNTIVVPQTITPPKPEVREIAIQCEIITLATTSTPSTTGFTAITISNRSPTHNTTPKPIIPPPKKNHTKMSVSSFLNDQPPSPLVKRKRDDEDTDMPLSPPQPQEGEHQSIESVPSKDEHDLGAVKRLKTADDSGGEHSEDIEMRPTEAQQDKDDDGANDDLSSDSSGSLSSVDSESDDSGDESESDAGVDSAEPVVETEDDAMKVDAGFDDRRKSVDEVEAPTPMSNVESTAPMEGSDPPQDLAATSNQDGSANPDAATPSAAGPEGAEGEKKKRRRPPPDGKRRTGYWSDNETRRLVAAVKIHGTSWTRVAKEVDTRDAGQCEKRWKRLDVRSDLAPKSWESVEDQALIALVNAYEKLKVKSGDGVADANWIANMDWNEISQRLKFFGVSTQGRTAQQCRERWFQIQGTRNRSGSTDSSAPVANESSSKDSRAFSPVAASGGFRGAARKSKASKGSKSPQKTKMPSASSSSSGSSSDSDSSSGSSSSSSSGSSSESDVPAPPASIWSKKVDDKKADEKGKASKGKGKKKDTQVTSTPTQPEMAAPVPSSSGRVKSPKKQSSRRQSDVHEFKPPLPPPAAPITSSSDDSDSDSDSGSESQGSSSSSSSSASSSISGMNKQMNVAAAAASILKQLSASSTPTSGAIQPGTPMSASAATAKSIAKWVQMVQKSSADAAEAMSSSEDDSDSHSSSSSGDDSSGSSSEDEEEDCASQSKRKSKKKGKKKGKETAEKSSRKKKSKKSSSSKRKRARDTSSSDDSSDTGSSSSSEDEEDRRSSRKSSSKKDKKSRKDNKKRRTSQDVDTELGWFVDTSGDKKKKKSKKHRKDKKESKKSKGDNNSKDKRSSKDKDKRRGSMQMTQLMQLNGLQGTGSGVGGSVTPSLGGPGTGKKGQVRPWSLEEDRMLLRSVLTFGNLWTRVAEGVTGRNPRQCKEHFIRVLAKNEPLRDLDLTGIASETLRKEKQIGGPVSVVALPDVFAEFQPRGQTAAQMQTQLMYLMEQGQIVTAPAGGDAPAAPASVGGGSGVGSGTVPASPVASPKPLYSNGSAVKAELTPSGLSDRRGSAGSVSSVDEPLGGDDIPTAPPTTASSSSSSTGG
ncbi:hypothetical protein HK102_003249, partial [Quaeritorhiza haematococci]